MSQVTQSLVEQAVEAAAEAFDRAGSVEEAVPRLQGVVHLAGCSRALAPAVCSYSSVCCDCLSKHSHPYV